MRHIVNQIMLEKTQIAVFAVMHVKYFSQYFTTATSNLILKLPGSGKNALHLCNSNSDHANRDSYFEFCRVSSARVREVSKGLQNSGSFSVYNLNVRIVKSIKEVILAPLTSAKPNFFFQVY